MSSASSPGDRSLYVRDPEGNVAEAWDYVSDRSSVDGLEET